MHELYKKYRPKKLDHLIGQPDAVRELKKMVGAESIPHTMILSGPSGCGKTSAALTLGRILKCSKAELTKVNVANFRGIDTAREIIKASKRLPMFGTNRVWIIDEAHRLTRDAQEALLEVLEFTPKHAYFFLCTTEPHALIKTIQNRATEVRFKAIGYKELLALGDSVLGKEGKEVSDEVVERIAEVADGSARRFLVILDKVIDLDNEKEQLAAIINADSKNEAKHIFGALLNPRTTWADMAKILKGVDDDPEGLRRYILAASRNVMLGGGKLAGRAAFIIKVFQFNTFDSGRAGFDQMCYEVVQPPARNARK